MVTHPRRDRMANGIDCKVVVVVEITRTDLHRNLVLHLYVHYWNGVKFVSPTTRVLVICLPA
jgi:hypothetical protein